MDMAEGTDQPGASAEDDVVRQGATIRIPVPSPRWILLVVSDGEAYAANEFPRAIAEDEQFDLHGFVKHLLSELDREMSKTRESARQHDAGTGKTGSPMAGDGTQPGS